MRERFSFFSLAKPRRLSLSLSLRSEFCPETGSFLLLFSVFLWLNFVNIKKMMQNFEILMFFFFLQKVRSLLFIITADSAARREGL